MAMIVTETSAVTASEAELRKDSPTTSETGRDRRSDCPKSPCTTPETQS